MTVCNITNLEPAITQMFNPYLLMTTLERIKHTYDKSILPQSLKKIRPQDTGKRKQFDALTVKFQELYERKTAQEAEYQAKIKAKAAERPRLQAGQTCRFTRYIHQ